MIDHNHPHDRDDLDPALEAAVQAVLTEPVPEDAIERVKMRAQQLETPPVAPLKRETAEGASRRFRSLVGALATAAALLIITGLSLVLSEPSGAFAQMTQKVKAADSVSLAMTLQFGRSPKITGRMFFRNDQMRIEQFDAALIQVADFGRQKALFLNTVEKRAEATVLNEDVVRRFSNPIDNLRKAKSEDAEFIGEEIIDDRRTKVYRLPKVDVLGMQGTGPMLVWIDRESELPVKIVIRDPDPKSLMEVQFDSFAWNRPLDDELFSLNVPAGYETGVVASVQKLNQQPRPISESPQAAPGFISRSGAATPIVWSPDGTMITAILRDPESVPATERRVNELRRWNVATGELQWSQSVAGASYLAASPDGKWLATVIGFEVQLRDAGSGKVIRTWTTERHLTPLAFSPDSKTLAAGVTQWSQGGKGSSGGVELWEVERGSLARFINDDAPTTSIRYSPSGDQVASSSNSGPVKLWDVGTGELKRILPGHLAMDLSPDGKLLAGSVGATAAAKNVGRVSIYDVQTAEVRQTLQSEEGAGPSYLLTVTFSPDGKLVAATDWNGLVTIWDVASGERRQTFREDAGVLAAAFSPNSSLLATGGENEILQLRPLTAGADADPAK